MIRQIFLNTLLGFLFLFATNSNAQSLKDTAGRIQKIVSEYTTESGPGGVLLIKKGERLLYQEAFGKSNLENGSLNDPNTIFEAGSVSKQFTATAILMLIEEGKLGFEDDIRQFIPELPKYNRPIKIRHLLNHSSGLKDWGSVAAISGWARGSKVYTNDQAFEIIIRQYNLNNIPGDEYIYSNSNYTCLTVIAERLSGMKLPEFTQKYIFDKLGMKNTQWRTDFRKTLPNRSTAYGQQEKQFVLQMPFENTYGHAGLLTTVSDLDKWNQSWKNSPLGKGGLLEMREKKGVLNDGTIISYASGVHVKELNGIKEVGHSGSTGGYKTWLAYYPELELSIVFLGNDGTINPSNLGQKLANYLLGNTPHEPTANNQGSSPKSVKESPRELVEYIGKYSSAEAEGFLLIELKGTELIVKNAAGVEKVFTQTDHGKFLNVSSSVELHFIKNQKGKVTGLSVQDSRARNMKFNKRSNSKNNG